MDLFAVLAVVTVTGRTAVSYTDSLKETLLSGCSGLLSCKCPGRRSDFGDDNALADFLRRKTQQSYFLLGEKLWYNDCKAGIIPRRFALSKARQTPRRTVCIPRRDAVASEKSWYNACKAGMISAPVRVEQSETNTLSNRAHPPEGCRGFGEVYNGERTGGCLKCPSIYR